MKYYIHQINKIFNLLLLTLYLSGCASSPRFTKERNTEPKSKQKSAESISKNSRATLFEGIASYYAHDFNGKKTASGELYDMYSKTAAHRSFPFETKVKVTNLDNDKSVIVRVNDRGPFKLERIMDLSLGAAEELDMIKNGTARVRLEVVEWGTDVKEN